MAAAGQRRDRMGVVVITGGTAGVGRATARAFAARGDDVAVIARGQDGLDATLRELHQAGVNAVAVRADVADAAAVEAAADQVELELGPIDIWVNNAMTAVLARVHQTSAEEFRRVTEVTYLGAVHGTLAALARMRPRDRGVIVQVGSALAYRSIPLQASYCAAKHAQRAFADALRVELQAENSGVRVTTVHLPGLNTPQFEWVRTTVRRHPMPVPPIYQPEVAARAIVHAASHAHKREHWVGRATVFTIIGNKLAPRVADWQLARSGIEGQQTDDPIPPDRPDYLFEPLPGDRGAHGRFGEQAASRSLQWEVARRKWPLLGAAAGAAGAAVAASLRRRS